MVPLADAFNHKASVVHLGDGFEIAELDELAPQAATSGKRKRRDDSAEAAQSGARPLLDDDAHPTEGQDGQSGDSAEARYFAAFPSCNVRLDMAICDDVVPAQDAAQQEVLRIIAAQDLASGVEVHNTYGEHGNDALLFKYGFVLPQNPFHAVRFTAAELAAGMMPHTLGRVHALAQCMQQSPEDGPDEWELPHRIDEEQDEAELEQWVERWLSEVLDDELGPGSADDTGIDDEGDGAAAELLVHGAGFVSGALACALLALGGTDILDHVRGREQILRSLAEALADENVHGAALHALLDCRRTPRCCA